MKPKLVIVFTITAAVILSAVIVSFAFTENQIRDKTETARENVLTYLDGIINAAGEDSADYLSDDGGIAYIESFRTLSTLRRLIETSDILDVTGANLGASPAPAYYIDNVKCGAYGHLIFSTDDGMFQIFFKEADQLIVYVQTLRKGRNTSGFSIQQ